MISRAPRWADRHRCLELRAFVRVRRGLSDTAGAVLVGYAPGGATDILARLIGQRLSERLGQQFVIESKPGAGNNIATEAVVNAEPDGYTVFRAIPPIGATILTEAGT
jgi:tripartite-type tricarboxylate transporter receptor subunit TctC